MNEQSKTYDEQLAEDIGGFAYDPLGFVLYAFPWGEGELAGMEGPQEWQREELEAIGQALRNGAKVEDAASKAVRRAIASGHGIGKSAFVAWVILWALSTHQDTRGVVIRVREGSSTGDSIQATLGAFSRGAYMSVFAASGSGYTLTQQSLKFDASQVVRTANDTHPQSYAQPIAIYLGRHATEV